MAGLEDTLKAKILPIVQELYGTEIQEKLIQFQKTRKEFEGDITIVVFPFVKLAKKKPEDVAEELGSALVNEGIVSGYNVVKGFLNLVLGDSKWLKELNKIANSSNFGFVPVTDDSPLAMVEYSSPNTNKPLHLGHIRNNLLGYSLANILTANGNKVVKTNIVNDRGIHICKSMLAWKKWGEGETPESSGIKGDHLVGKYYVRFDQEYKKEQAAYIAEGKSKDEAEASSELMEEAREMLRQWEDSVPEVYNLWETMNQWVYAGFDLTYKALGVDFDKIYYESKTFKEGKGKVMEGLEKGVFYQREDNSVWADLTADGLDEKLLLRSDGTSVYMTQDIGTAKLRFDDYPIDKMIYVVGNEQIYHFQVLSLLLDKVGFEWGKDLVHFSYGMVELPQGKMKSREGTVVDADDLVKEMIETARETSKELGKLEGYTEEEAEKVYETVALGALKYYMLKVDPRKGMMFNPEESIDFNGNTGPFIQYTYARIQSILRKADALGLNIPNEVAEDLELEDKETALLTRLSYFPQIVKDAGDNYSPALIANYVYELVKEYNQFYHDVAILKETDLPKKEMRLLLSKVSADIVKRAVKLLGMDVPERM